MSACLASIFELPIKEVPTFAMKKYYWDHVQAWLRERGYYVFTLNTGTDGYDQEQLSGVIEGYHTMAGPGPRGCRHVVVGKSGKVVHDPHPSRAGLLEIDEWDLYIPIDPARKEQP